MGGGGRGAGLTESPTATQDPAAPYPGSARPSIPPSPAPWPLPHSGGSASPLRTFRTNGVCDRATAVCPAERRRSDFGGTPASLSPSPSPPLSNPSPRTGRREGARPAALFPSSSAGLVQGFPGKLRGAELRTQATDTAFHLSPPLPPGLLLSQSLFRLCLVYGGTF